MTADPKPFSNFAELEVPAPLKENLERLGLRDPTPIQAQAIPKILVGKDLIGQSQTGSGKTAAYLVPVIARLDFQSPVVQAIVLTPTRELCVQVAEVANDLVFNTGLRVMAIFGGFSLEIQAAALRQGVQLVLGTPGRVKDLIMRERLDLSQVKHFILDEADEMLDMGFLNDITYIANRTPKVRQNLLFSATMAPPVKQLINDYMNTPEHIAIEQVTRTADTISHKLVRAGGREKDMTLRAILNDLKPDAALIFSNKKHAVSGIARSLKGLPMTVEYLHGGLEQEERMRIMRHFRAGRIQVLVCTDVAARGLDVLSVSLVVNYDLPPDPDVYIHRVGRTGRIGEKGLAISLVGPHEQYLLGRVESHARIRLEPYDTSRLNIQQGGGRSEGPRHGRGPRDRHGRPDRPHGHRKRR
ncbi:DEAD/DEAH box helicase [bacterium]|nr:DEAD/DEAH box helicase [bacterium]